MIIDAPEEANGELTPERRRGGVEQPLGDLDETVEVRGVTSSSLGELVESSQEIRADVRNVRQRSRWTRKRWRLLLRQSVAELISRTGWRRSRAMGRRIHLHLVVFLLIFS